MSGTDPASLAGTLTRGLLAEFAADGVRAEDFGFHCRLYPRPLRGNGADRAADPDGGIHIGHRDTVPVYPASTVKLFYLAAFHHWVETGRLQPDSEDLRALAAMIRQSSNDATNYLLARLTDAGPGGVLPPAEMTAWWERRRAVDRWFAGWGRPEFAGLRLWHGTFDEGPYGRERVARAAGGNLIPPAAAAALMAAIAGGRAISPAADRAMLELLDRGFERDPAALPPGYEDQVRGFLGGGLPDAVRLWSKAGWTSETRHDVVYLETPGGRSCVAAVYTTGAAMARNPRFLPAVGRRLLALLG
jgi:beta-lactamase class A